MKSATDPEIESEIEPEIESELEPEIEPEIESELEPEIEPEIESELEPAAADEPVVWASASAGCVPSQRHPLTSPSVGFAVWLQACRQCT